jgi:polar amino acid transport system permease protein
MVRRVPEPRGRGRVSGVQEGQGIPMFSLTEMWSFLPALLEGAYLTITVSLLSFALATVIGLLVGLARISRLLPLRILATPYVQFIRGTPLLLQLFFIYYVLPYGGIILSPFVSGLLGLTLNYSAYMAEVFRGGVLAIPKGQWEAGLSVGMSRRLLLRRIILPQALRIVIPAIGNFFVSIFKDSALVSIVTMRDLMFSGQILAAATFKHFEIFAMVAVIYFVISYPTAKFVEYIEKRLDISRAKHVEAQARG